MFFPYQRNTQRGVAVMVSKVYTFFTSALNGGEWSDSHPCCSPGKEPPEPIGEEAGWAPEPFWTQ